MIRVKALQTSSGEYGKLKRGQTADLRGSVARELEKQKIVEIISDDDGKDVEPEKVSGGVRIKDNTTGQMLMDSKVILKDTRESVTGVKPEAEKAEEKKKVEEKAEQSKEEQTHTPKKVYK